MSNSARSGRRPNSLEVGKAKRTLVQLAAMLAALAGLVSAVGFLAFGHVFLASPEANNTVLSANLPDSYGIALFAGAMVLSFLGGVVAVALITYRAEQFRRTWVLVCTTFTLVTAYLTFADDMTFTTAGLLAFAMGTANCVFERDNSDLQEAMSPSAQIVRFGEELAKGRSGPGVRQIGVHASFWLAFLLGGVAGAGAWLAIDSRAIALAAGFAGLLTFRTWLIERDLSPA
jgi:uncharacterized membrane protein YoaK (UPF0700 family)